MDLAEFTLLIWRATTAVQLQILRKVVPPLFVPALHSREFKLLVPRSQTRPRGLALRSSGCTSLGREPTTKMCSFLLYIFVGDGRSASSDVQSFRPKDLNLGVCLHSKLKDAIVPAKELGARSNSGARSSRKQAS